MKRNLLIALGGGLGALARYGMKLSPFAHNPWDFPLHTLVTNLAGCFLIAAFLTAASEHLEVDADVRVGVATGFIGAFTTFSTLCKESGLMMASGGVLAGAIYAVLSLLLGFGAVYLGALTARKGYEVLNSGAQKSGRERRDAS